MKLQGSLACLLLALCLGHGAAGPVQSGRESTEQDSGPVPQNGVGEVYGHQREGISHALENTGEEVGRLIESGVEHGVDAARSSEAWCTNAPPSGSGGSSSNSGESGSSQGSGSSGGSSSGGSSSHGGSSSGGSSSHGGSSSGGSNSGGSSSHGGSSSGGSNSGGSSSGGSSGASRVGLPLSGGRDGMRELQELLRRRLWVA
ncbi:putative dermokine [Sciurus carolinensis]|uniref:Dermokine n=1 Tax=Sciurus carolinensis TaxID=30640 RepID=A0AA41T6L9_SCICA|nr:putative dermokine [Sciurus carolinensis]